MSRLGCGLFVVLFVVVVVCGVSAGGAVAGTVQVESIGSGGSISAVSLGSLSFQAEGVSVACPVTLRGTLESGRLPIVEEAEMGLVKEVAIGRCSGGTLAAVLNLEWFVRTGAILGSLPERVTGQAFVLEEPGLRFNVTISGRAAECLYQGDLDMLLALSGRNPYTTGLIRSLGNSISLVRERSSASCPASGRLTGTLSLTEETIEMSQDTYPLVPNVWAVIFHNPRINSTTFTFTNNSGAGVTGISATMGFGGRGFTVPATACNGLIANGNTCQATVTLTGNATAFDLVEIVNSVPNALGRAWVYP